MRAGATLALIHRMTPTALASRESGQCAALPLHYLFGAIPLTTAN
jgi:hypothetical protein